MARFRTRSLPAPSLRLAAARLSAAAITLIGAVGAQTPARFAFLGDDPGDLAGLAVASAGDLDRDGRDDVLVSLRGDATNGPSAGAVRAYSGRTGQLLHAWFGNSSYDFFGLSVGPAGDVDGDGTPDVVIGAPRDEDHVTPNDGGRVWVFSGADGRTILGLRGDSTGEQLGRFVRGIGDVDGDGYDDLVAGAPFDDTNGTDAGEVKVFSGRTGAVVFRAHGDAAGDELARNCGAAGDVDADGWPDVVAGARLHDTALGADVGMARVYSGRDGRVLFTWYGDAAGDQFGQATGPAGDVDRDGHADVVVGAHTGAGPAGAEAGYVRVFSGRDGSILFTWHGAAAGDRLGQSVDGCGDVDGDGHPDLIAGADRADVGGTDTGSVYVWSGADGRVLDLVHGTARGGLFGHSVATAGDVDGDGFADWIGGAYLEDVPASGGGTLADAGSARVHASAATGSPPRVERVGAPCATASGVLPRIVVDGRAALGDRFAYELRSAIGGGTVMLDLGLPFAAPLGPFGAPGCVLVTYPLDGLRRVADGNGRSRVELNVPAGAAGLVGATLRGQWLVFDAAANDLGLVVSDAADVVIGS